MVDDDLDVFDVEHSILTGDLERVEEEDPRGTKYVVVGKALDDELLVTTVGRFTDTGPYLIITAYGLD